ncbi:MAG TPA: hypothetical protein VMZ51_03695 [Acidimicrobiales bacterium]|nr:hypothetical protein [Acidimicrobiales bacterium]
MRSVTFCEVDRPALVLGSTQPSTDADSAAAAAAGVDVVRRRSGGGAVLVEPRRMVWADVVVPSSDPLWQADVGRAFWWLGDVLAAALDSLGVPGLAVHRGGLLSSRWSRMVCFAGIGPGEVTAAGAKVVGISQRRVRSGSFFQCAIPRVWDPHAMAALLALDATSRSRFEADARLFAAAVAGIPADQLEQAVVGHLPAGGQTA